MGMDVIPRCERLLYWIGGVGSIFYCLYSFYTECHDKTDLVETETGIELLGGTRDFTDSEWTTLCDQIPYLVPLLCGHVLIGQLLHFIQIEIWLQKSARLLYDILAIMYIFGTRATLLCIVEASVMYLVTLQRHTAVVWVMGLFFTSTLNIGWILQKQLRLVQYLGNETTTFFISISYVHIRLISACIEIIKHRNSLYKSHPPKGSVSSQSLLEKSHRDKKVFNKSNSDFDSKQGKYTDPFLEASLVDYFTYIFYLPVFFPGPILTFDTFLSEISMFYHSRSHSYDLKGIIKKLTKIVLVAFFIEFQAHFMYVQSVQAYPYVLSTLSIPSIIGLGIWQGHYFYLKYLCLFGIGHVFCPLDGLTAIPLPACIGWIYSFSEMWKRFDVGLYNFIKKYIYIPWGGSKAGVLQQFFGTVTAFFYVCYWHGADTSILIWCCGNAIIVILEITAGHLEYSTWGSKVKSVLGAANVQRLRGLFATPLYIASALQVMYFFFSFETGSTIVDVLIWSASWKALLLEHICIYCAIQNAMLIRKWSIEKQKSKVS